MTDKKKFGLVLPKKMDAFKMKKNSVFNDDSDEDERVHKRPKIPQKKMDLKLKTDTMEDPSVYEYDSIYDEMKREQRETTTLKKKENSRYIETLKKAAEKRKKEYERRIDKKIQAEREKEGDKYKDKEAFVTSSYKKKMLEQEEEAERERHENMLNEMMDVTKQQDLSGFYRHFLKQAVGEEKVPLLGERQIKEDRISDEDSTHKNDKNVQDGHSLKQAVGEEKVPLFDETQIKKEKVSDEDSSHMNDKNVQNYEEIDEDSDNVDIDSESLNSNEELHSENQKQSTVSESQKTEKSSSKDKSKISLPRKHSRTSSKNSIKNPSLNVCSSESEDNNLPTGKSSQSTNSCNFRHDSYSSSDSSDESNEKTTDVGVDCNKNKSERNLNIFAKRTVGDIFAEAQARYFQRMALQVN